MISFQHLQSREKADVTNPINYFSYGITFLFAFCQSVIKHGNFTFIFILRERKLGKTVWFYNDFLF